MRRLSVLAQDLRGFWLVAWLAVCMVCVFLMTRGIETLVDPHVRVIDYSGQPAWMGTAMGIFMLVSGPGFIVAGAIDHHQDLQRRQKGEETQERAAALMEGLASGLTSLAVALAGRRRRDHVRDAWLSDLERPRDPADGGVPGVSASKKVTYAAGFVRAAVRYRIGDAGLLWWRVADGVLASRPWSRMVLVGPCTMAAAMIVHRDGLYGLVTNAENLIAIGTASAGLIYGGRKARKVTPKPARQKQDQA